MSATETVPGARQSAPTSASSSYRLAYLVSRYPAVSHTFILREVEQLRRLGFQIDVVSVNDPDRPAGRMTGQEQGEAARTFYLKRAGVFGALSAHVPVLFGSPLRYVRAAWFAFRLGGTDLRQIVFGLLYFVEAVMVGQWMRRRRLCHLHVHFATPASTVGLIAAKLFPITFSLTVHGPDEFYDVGAYRLREKIAGASFVCCIGFYARSQLMKISPPAQWPKFEVCPLGVDSTIFAPADPQRHGDGLRVLCVGRLVEAKGQHVLIEAMAKLSQAGRNVQLRLIGEGPDRRALDRAVAERGLARQVSFEGAVNQDDIGRFYREADVFALASFAEGIPVVLMEAMAMEIPCVTTFITGIPELIRDGIDGLLVAPSDADGLAEAIAKLQDDPELRQRIGAAGRRRVSEKYDLVRNTTRLAEVFRRRLGGIA